MVIRNRELITPVIVLLCFTCTLASSSFQLAALINYSETSYHTAFQLALDDVNRDANILPNVTLVFDIRNLYIEALQVAAMIDFHEQDQTLVIGNEFSRFSIQTGIAGTVYGISQLSSISTSSRLSNQQNFQNFNRISSPGNGQIETIREALLYFQQQRDNEGNGWTNVALISTTDEYGVDAAELFIEASVDENDFTVLTYQQYLPDETNFDVELREIQNSGARVIIMMILTQWDLFIRKADEYGLVGEHYVWVVPDTFVGRDSFEDKLAEVLSNGVLGLIQHVPTGGAFEEYWMSLDPEEYPGAGPGNPPGAYARLAYDTVLTAAYAIDDVYNMGLLDEPRISPSIWNEAIRNVKFDGSSGFVSFDNIGDRISQSSLSYYNLETHSWRLSALWSEEEGLEFLEDIIWFSNTTDIPDLDIRPPFDYWSCYDKEQRTDKTGKTVSLHSPAASNVDEIESHYHCDNFIDCQNLSDESIDCNQNFTAIFIVFGIITGLLILVTFTILIFVIVFGIILKYRRLRVASPYFLVILLISIIIGFSSVFAWFGKPHPVACGFQPWLLGLSAISMVTSLGAKTFRIWRIFRKELKHTQISDWLLLRLWFLTMIPAVLILIVWTIVSTPTAKMQELEGEDHFVCATGGFFGEPGGFIFFGILVGYGTLILLFGIFLSIVTRNVPSLFNESKLLAVSIYNLAFLCVVIIPVVIVIQSYEPFAAWIVRTVAILYAFTATLILQFAPPLFHIIFIDRLTNPFVTAKASSTATGTATMN